MRKIKSFTTHSQLYTHYGTFVNIPYLDTGNAAMIVVDTVASIPSIGLTVVSILEL